MQKERRGQKEERGVGKWSRKERTLRRVKSGVKVSQREWLLSLLGTGTENQCTRTHLVCVTVYCQYVYVWRE